MKTVTFSPRLKKIVFTTLLLIGTASLFAGGVPQKAALLFGFTTSDIFTADTFRPNAAPFDANTSAATINTDKDDYRPGETVVITGAGWFPNETVRLQVVHYDPPLAELTPHQGHDEWFVSADGEGNVSAAWLVDEDSLNQTLLLTADGVTSLAHAEKFFTDSSIGLYNQCSNDDGDGYPAPDPGCRWTNGNLQRNNSTYREDDATVQRLWLTDFVPGELSQAVTLQYGTTKGGKHAYDYLTDWDHSEFWIEESDLCQDIAGCVGATETRFDIPDDPLVPPAILPAGAPNQIAIRGGTITNISAPSLFSGSYAADSETRITITFDVSDSGLMCGPSGGGQNPPIRCSVAIFFGAHISETALWVPVDGRSGATTISGSPYHVALSEFNGASIGNRDNQMQAGAIVLPTAQLTIVKEALPDDPQDFTFDPSANLNGDVNFMLDDDGSTGTEACTGGDCVKQRTFTALQAGNYSVAEISIPTGWDLTEATCSDGSLVSSIDISSGENVICTFTNRKPDAQIDLSPLTATNEVGDAHTITATVQQDDQYPAGSPGDAATGFGPAPDGTTVTFSLLNDTAGATFVSGNTCQTTNGACSVQINTNTAGSVDIHATTTFTVLTESLTRATGTGGNNSADANKIYVDAQIDIDPLTATNDVNDAHTFTATVQQNDGLAAAAGGDGVTGWAPAPDGTLVTFSFVTNTIGAVFVDGINTCSTSGGTGTCTVDINSASPGTVTVSATTTFTVGGLSMTRTTDGTGNNSGTAQKTYVASRLRIKKLVDPNTDTTSFTFAPTGGWNLGSSFQLQHNGTKDSGYIAPGTYGATETVPSDWDLSARTCVNTADSTAHTFTTPTDGVSVILAAGEDVTCTFTNTKRGSITIVKNAVPNDLQDFSFTATEDTSTTIPDFSLDDDSGVTGADNTFSSSREFDGLKPGTYTVTEDGETGWSLTDLSCGAGGTPSGSTATIVLPAGGSVTCTFTNTKDATVTIVKNAIPDDAQDFAFTTTGTGPTGWDSFSLDDDADVTLLNSRTFTFPASQQGAKTVTEGAVSGWDLTGLTCSEGSTDLPTRTASFTVDPGDAITCTFTNTKRGHIVVDKVTNPSGDSQSFSFVAGGAGYNNFSLTDAAAPNDQELVPGAYSVTETVPTGWDLTNTACVSSIGDTESAAALELDPGETITCTFTNTKDANIVVVKQTDPDGDSAVFDFTASYDADGFSLSDGQSNDSGDLDPGTYNVAETAKAGWDLISSPCVSSNGDSETIGSISLQAGETVTCTFTNQKDAKIVVVKQTDPDGDSAVFDFTASYDADGFSLSDGQSNDSGDLDPGTYNVAETAKAGWALTSATCSDGSAPSSIGLAAGETVTCTFTNTKLGSITIRKDAVPNDAQDFAFTTTGSGISSFSLDDDADPVLSNQKVFSDLLPGARTVTETVTSGWQLTDLVCTGGGANTSTSLGTRTASIALDAGEDIVCTFTNTKLGSLTIIKDAIPNDVQDFAFTTTGGLTPPSFSLDDDGDATLSNTQTYNDLLPGSFTVTEGATSGWSLTDLVCTGGGGNTTTSTGTRTATIGLDAGETVTCTFTNTKLGTIIVEKQTNPDGASGSFTFTGDASGSISDNGQITVSNLAPGTYTSTESDPTPAFDLTSIICDDGSSTTPSTTDTATRTATFQLDPGETVKCTFTNTQRGAIKIVKNTVGGDGTFQFNPTGFGSGSFNLTTVSGTQETTFSNIVPGGTYSITETDPSPAFDLMSFTCDNGTTAGITVVAGQTTTCTATNTKRGSITIIKDAVPNDAQDFDFTSTSNQTTTIGSFVLDDDADPVEPNSRTFSNLKPGNYSVTETGETGWDLTNLSCGTGGTPSGSTANIVLGAGGSVTCTFTNTKRGHLELEKFTNGQARPDININFRLYLDGVVDGDLSGDEVLRQTLSTFGDADGNLVFDEVAPGNYTVCEYPVPAGYTSMWTFNGGVITPYNPEANDPVPGDIGNRCADFVIGAGQTVSMHVDNDFPGGDPRTIGYWKNWNRCTKGGQADNADRNGGGANGFWLLEDLMPQTIGDLVLINCEDAVNILDKSDLSGRKKASDAAYELAAQLLAAKLNLAAGAETCTAIQNAVIDGQNLLDGINFDGTGNYLASKKGPTATTRTQALLLANTLDRYNNGLLCP